MTNDVLQELRNVRGRIAGYESYIRHNGEHEVPRRFITELRAQERALEQETKNMPNIDIPRAGIARLQAELGDLHRAAGDRKLSPEQQTRWDAIETEIRELEDAIAGHEATAARAARVAENRAHWGTVEVSPGTGTASIDPAAIARMDRKQATDAALRSLDGAAAAHLTADQKAGVEATLRGKQQVDTSPDSFDPAALAKHVLLTSSEDYRAAWRQVVTSPSPVTALSERQLAIFAEVQRASMAEGTGSTGGYAVPAYLDPTILLTSQGSANPIPGLASRAVITTSEWKGVSSAGVSWSWKSEGAAATDASPTLAQPAIPVHLANAWITYSIELQQDAVELDRQLFALLQSGFNDVTAAAFATGSGTGQPLGLVTALDAVPGSEVQITAPGALAAADISKVWQALPDRARDNASWLMSESVRETIAGWGTEKRADGTVDLTGRLDKLRGRPVYSTEKMPAIDTTTGTANQMIVGDMTGYMCVTRAGMLVEPVQHVVNGSGVPTGQRGLFAYARVGGGLIDPGKLRLLQQ